MARCDSFTLLGRALSPVAQGDEAIGALRNDICYNAVNWEDILELAGRHLVMPGLCQALSKKGLMTLIPTVVQGYLKMVYRLNRERNQRIAEQLAEITAMLSDSDIHPVLLKGVAHLQADLYSDCAARIISDIDLLVPREQLMVAVDRLAAAGYRNARMKNRSFEHHHYPPLAHSDRVAWVELHTEPVRRTFLSLLPAKRVMQGARPLTADGSGMRVPALHDQVICNIIHTQLADRNYWSGRVSLRHLSDLAWLRMASNGEIDWKEIQYAFDRAGYNGACCTYLLAAERLFGQATPPEFGPGIGARLAYWRVGAQNRYSSLMAMGEWHGYHRAVLTELCADPLRRRRLLLRLLHPGVYRRYVRSFRRHVGWAA